MLELAAETWLEILQKLPRGSIVQVSLTNHRFRTLSIPLLFAHFKFHPYALNSNGYLLPEATHLQAAYRRLEFWSSEPIARHVRSCHVEPWNELFYPSWRFSVAEEPLQLLAAFFRCVDCLTILTKLSLYTIELLPNHLTRICCLPTLDALTVRECKMVPSATAIDHPTSQTLILRVGALAFEHHDTETNRFRLWLPPSHPHFLHPLSLIRGLTALCGDLATVPSSPNVKLLTFRMDALAATVEQNVRVVERFPSLKQLDIRECASRPDLTNFDVGIVRELRLPELTTLSAPCGLLPCFLHEEIAPILSSLSVLSCSPEIVASTLRRTALSQYPTIASLALDLVVAAVDSESDAQHTVDQLVHEILSYFSALTILDLKLMWIRDEDDAEFNGIAQQFFSALPSTNALPPSLRGVSIHATFTYADDPEAEEDVGHSTLIPVREAFTARFTQLSYLWLDADTFLYRWRLGDEIIEEFFELDEVEDARETFDSFCRIP
ncbi:hypothetical protein C8F01DRAFT_1010053 [Mycena amicta]|nr:hypothetical protein C8F01DRAFT_1010053 [Mycena amicta]